MDQFDKNILRLLQEDSSLSNAEIANRVGLSATPCWRRVQNLQQRGYIRKQVALLDRNAIDLGVDVFVSIKTSRHNADWLTSFAEAVSSFPEVVEFYRMSGDIDYLMRVVVSDIGAYDAFYRRLIERVDIQDVSSSFAMERIKYTTALPLDRA